MTDTAFRESTRRLRLSPGCDELEEPSATDPMNRCNIDFLELDLWLQTLHDIAHLELG
jgi:hypothetical protein